jgi:hypothetical protein
LVLTPVPVVWIGKTEVRRFSWLARAGSSAIGDKSWVTAHPELRPQVVAELCARESAARKGVGEETILAAVRIASVIHALAAVMNAVTA